jgi:hypothetical protein
LCDYLLKRSALGVDVAFFLYFLGFSSSMLISSKYLFPTCLFRCMNTVNFYSPFKEKRGWSIPSLTTFFDLAAAGGDFLLTFLFLVSLVMGTVLARDVLSTPFSYCKEYLIVLFLLRDYIQEQPVVCSLCNVID